MEPAGGGGGGRDRLSNLPDCLLHSVLSCLGSRQVVQSSLLSPRWRHLWRGVPCLDIDQREFPLDLPVPESPAWNAPEANRKAFRDTSQERAEREVQLWHRFEDFGDTLLPLHAAASSPPALPLDAYRLHVTCAHQHRCLYRWIRRGLARSPAALHVTNGDDDEYMYNEVPSFSLHSHHYKTDSLPLVLQVATRLRRLHLSGFSLPEEFSEELTADTCPVLEDLRLERCDFWFARIASLSLKSLAMEGCSSNCSYDGSTELALAVPRLVSLNLGDVQLPVVSEDEMPSLAVASVTATRDANAYAGGVGVLKSLRAARVLALRSFNSAELFDEEPKEFLKFQNLRTLTLTECKIGDECQVLRHVLHNVPNLERLVLDDCKVP